MSDEPNGRATTATLDRRVERLEVAQAETNRTVDRLVLGQDHLRELVLARFSTIDATSANANTKLDRLFGLFQEDAQKTAAAEIERQKSAANWRDTPAGREYTAEMNVLRTKRDIDSSRIESIEKRQYLIAGGLGVLIFIGNLFGPVLAKLVFGVE